MNAEYNTRIRDNNADLVINSIKETASFEDLYDIFQKHREETSSLGHRVHECGKMFTNRLAELARSEPEILIAILTLRNSWENEGYSPSRYTSRDDLTLSTKKVYFYIIHYFKRNFLIEITEQPIDPGYGNEQNTQKYESRMQKWKEEIGKISLRYSKSINTKQETKTKTLRKLVFKLKKFESCRLIFSSKWNKEIGGIMIRKMCRLAKTYDELVFCINVISNRENGRTEMKEELLLVLEKLKKLI